MQVKDLMILAADVLHPDDRIRDAHEKMKASGLDLLPVCQDDRIVGIVTQESVTAQAERLGLAVGAAPVRDVMRAEIGSCRDDQGIEEAAQVMDRHPDLPALLVLDRQGRLVGILPSAVLRGELPERRKRREPEGKEPFESIRHDPVDHMSEESFPASDPPPGPSSVAPDERDPP